MFDVLRQLKKEENREKMENYVKKQFLNNMIVRMRPHLDRDILKILEDSLTEELAGIRMDGESNLPEIYQKDTDRKNQYVLQLFQYKTTVKKNTRDAYLRSVENLITVTGKPLMAVEESDISYYLHWYENQPREKQLENTTYNNERRFLSAFFTWMRKEKLIQENPVECIGPRRIIRKPIDYFRQEEMIRLRDACRNVRERALVEVLRSTGARVGELVKITIQQVDWGTGDVLILGEKSERYRVLYLDDDARHYLRAYLDSREGTSSYLFPKSRAPYTEMTTGGIRTILKAIGKRAGVESRVYPHKMRKTLGMNLKNKDVDIGTIQEIMGHASPAVTAQYYAQSTPETLRNIRKRVA